jgi:hypothetical protein
MVVVSLFFINDLRCSQGKNLGLLWCKDVVPIKINKGSDDGNNKKRDKARPVIDDPGKWEHDRHPPDDIIEDINHSINGALFSRSLFSCVFP